MSSPVAEQDMHVMRLPPNVHSLDKRFRESTWKECARCGTSWPFLVRWPGDRLVCLPCTAKAWRLRRPDSEKRC